MKRLHPTERQLPRYAKKFYKAQFPVYAHQKIYEEYIDLGFRSSSAFLKVRKLISEGKI